MDHKFDIKYVTTKILNFNLPEPHIAGFIMYIKGFLNLNITEAEEEIIRKTLRTKFPKHF
jgi:hypothetical protein